jgi:hypothetical protein
MNPDQYAIRNFLLDKSFCDWVKHENPREDLYWDNWLNQHPEKTRLVEEASAIIKGLPFIPKERPYGELIASRQLLLENIRLSRKTSGLPQPIAGPKLFGRGFLCRWQDFFKGFWPCTRIRGDKEW